MRPGTRKAALSVNAPARQVRSPSGQTRLTIPLRESAPDHDCETGSQNSLTVARLPPTTIGPREGPPMVLTSLPLKAQSLAGNVPAISSQLYWRLKLSPLLLPVRMYRAPCPPSPPWALPT